MNNFYSAFTYLGQPVPCALMALGTTLGVVVGAIPGLTGTMLIALTIPFTFAMSGNDALILLVSMYVGSVSGGLISATLLRMPGTPASIMTTLDGYPLAQKGKPGRALGLGISASLFGGLVSWGFLVLLSKPLADASILLGPFDFFSLVLMALVLIAIVSGKSLLRGMLSGFLGMLATMPGPIPATGERRWTLGFRDLDDGLRLLPVLIGLFAVNQIISNVVFPKDKPQVASRTVGSLLLRWQDWKRHLWNLLRSSFIGTWVGILPGIGANVASVLAYGTARSRSKEPDKFGQGSEEGIIASEAANNATVGGALIPLISLGIPGSVIDAVLIGALMIHGLQPGPLLFQDRPDVVWTIMTTYLVANVFMFGLMTVTSRWMARLMDVPKESLAPILLVCCIFGSYALSNRAFDVWVMLFFGLVGFGMERLKLPLAPFVIGFVLAPIAEKNLASGLMQSGGSYWPIVTRPVSLIFCLVSLGPVLWPILRYVHKQALAGRKHVFKTS